MAETKKTTKKTVFDVLYEKTDESIKALKKPLIKRQVTRKFTSAYDDAENNVLNANVELQEIRGNFGSFDVNAILEQKLIIEENETLQRLIAAEYKELFGTDIPKN